MYNNYGNFSTSNSAYGRSPIVNNYNYSNKPTMSHTNNKPEGLQNLTNTCYMSAVLQVLFLILKQNQFPSRKDNHNITNSFFELKKSHSKRDYQIFKKIVEQRIQIVQGWEQQDAHQFLISLLDQFSNQNMKSLKGGSINLSYNEKEQFQTNWNKFIVQMSKIENSKIIELFYGQALRQFKCPKGHLKHIFQRYQHLSLPIPQSKNYSYSNQQFTLQQLIDHYLKDQTIEGLQCESCKTKHTFNKKIVLYTLPKYLILHIARFRKSYYSHEKNSAFIKFDQVLQLNQYQGKKKVNYKLFGIINHYGTLNRGHYISQVKVNNEWYELNDQKVSTTVIKSYSNNSKYVYLLIYQRL